MGHCSSLSTQRELQPANQYLPELGDFKKTVQRFSTFNLKT